MEQDKNEFIIVARGQLIISKTCSPFCLSVIVYTTEGQIVDEGTLILSEVFGLTDEEGMMI
jgi:hypothetical protein